MLLKVLIVTFAVAAYSSPESLKVITTNTRIPAGRKAMKAAYDGDDSIYLFGGVSEYSYYDILKYSITNETVQTVETMGTGSSRRSSGSVDWAGNDSTLYFGGFYSPSSRSKIFTFKTSVLIKWSATGVLSWACYYTASVWDGGEYFYNIGGTRGYNDPANDRLDIISRYSNVTNIDEEVARLPKPTSNPTDVWDKARSVAYIFGGVVTTSSRSFSNEILKFDPSKENASVTTLDVKLPTRSVNSCTVWTGTEAYLIGGLPDSGEPWPTIASFNPSTNEVVNVNATGLPANMYEVSCAYVEKLNRIYILGGYTYADRYRDQIMYIDLV